MPNTQKSQPWLTSFATAFALFAAVFASVAIGNSLTQLSGRGTATVWLANGLVVGVLLCAPRCDWPRLMVAGASGLLAADFAGGDSASFAFPLTAINALEIAGTAWWLRFQIGASPDLTQWKASLWFLGIGGLLAPAVTAALGASFLWLSAGKPFGVVFLVWFMADALGMLSTVPAALCFQRGDTGAIFSRGHRPLSCGFLAVFVLTTAGIVWQTQLPLLYVIHPLSMMAAALLGFPVVAIAMPLMAGIVLTATRLGHGPFALQPELAIPERLLMAQFFICTGIVLTLATAALAADRRRAMRDLLNERRRLLESNRLHQESEARYRLIADNSSDVIIVSGLDLVRHYISPGSLEMLGFTPEELAGTRPDEFIHPDDAKQVLTALRDLVIAPRDRAMQLPYRIRHRDGSWVWVESQFRVLRDPVSGAARDVCASMRDIGARVAAEAALRAVEEQREAQRQELIRSNADLEEFAYVASHDLKAPLRGIAHLAEWIRRDVATSASKDTLENLDLLDGRVRRLQALQDGLLEYSRIGRANVEVSMVDTGAMVAEIRGLLAPPETFAVTAKDLPAAFRTHETALRTVLLNLIGNALKHRDQDRTRVEVSARMSQALMEFRVADDGPGIPERFHGRIFQIFQTLKPRDELESSGIGLALVKKHVERHGGRIWVESAPPARGTTFVFTWREEPA